MPLDPTRTMSLGFAFAERASDAAERRIRSDLRRIAEAIDEADPHAEALVLTGGFSRGEGTVRDDAPVNDYDLICVRARPGGDALYRGIDHRMTAELGIHVDLMPVWRPRLRAVGRKLFWLDLRLGGRVIAGDRHALETLRRFPPSSLPRTEAARLLGNRAAGLLLSLPAHGEPADPHQRDLQAVKAVLAAMDATLISRGEYAARMRDRLALTADHPDHALFATAVQWKLAGGAGGASTAGIAGGAGTTGTAGTAAGTELPAGTWDQAADCLLRAVDATGARETRDGLVEHAFYALRARRLAWAPSRRVRERAWELLAQQRWGLSAPSWSDEKPRFFARRAMTLQ